MAFLSWLENLRIPILNEIMLLITMLGEETAFLVIALIVFWCVDKRRGYLLMAVGFVGTVINQFLKMVCMVPRPWLRGITPVEEAKAAAGGYSFPSGHTTMAVGTFGSLAATDKKKWRIAAFISVAVIVGFSRMYLGVHTPEDVFVGAITSLALICAMKPILYGQNKKWIYGLLGGMVVLATAFTLYVELYPFPADYDMHNFESGLKNAYTMLGCVTGALVVYITEEKFVRFCEGGTWWVQLIKIIGGIGIVLAVKEGLRGPLEAVFAGHMAARAVRYFLIVLVAGILWPMTFQFWRGLAEKRKKNGTDSCEETQ